jgi:3-mercaptopyruvate sulfurtransferase SseA/uncharacterized membrane protein YedE/YeeE
VRGLVAFVSGLLFALGLGVGGMTQPSKVLAFLDVAGDWDPSLAFVMGGALLVYFFVGRVALARPRPLFDDTFHVPTRRDVDARLVLGAVLFGAGWGLAGYCPGPALVSLASGRATVVVFVAAMLAGIWIFQRRNARGLPAAQLRAATAASLVALGVLTGAQTGGGAQPGAVRAQMLVDGGWLVSRLDQPGLVVLHVGKSRGAYDRAHVPGARFVAFGDVATSGGAVPNEMPSVEELTVLVRRLGITGDPGERIVIYGEDEGLLAARVFVALDSLGLAGNVALLDGQWAGWQAEGRPVTTEVRAVGASSDEPRPRPERIATLATVADLSRRATASPDAPIALVDARPRAQFDGSEAGEGVPRPGHVPGAVNAFWKEDLQSGVPRLRAADELRARYAALGVAPDDVVVAYCRTGVQASHTYFVLAYLGYDVRLYDGSFAEWSAAPGMPVARP